jgi:hypothetical protein
MNIYKNFNNNYNNNNDNNNNIDYNNNNNNENNNYNKFNNYRTNLNINSYVPFYPNKNKNFQNSDNNHNNSQNYRKTSFSTENYSNYSDEALAKISPYLIKEQNGCRFIQEKVMSSSSFSNDLLFPQLKSSLTELICDQFGNYLFQVLLDVLTFDNLSLFLNLTHPNFYQICTSAHGTRVIQKLIEKVSNIPILLNKFIYNICNENLKEIIKAPYGNHIIQKFLMTVHSGEYKNGFIYQCVKDNFLEITNSKHGVCVVQKCIAEGDEEQRTLLLNMIYKNLDVIINDQFGNFLIQYIITSNDLNMNDMKDIINKISNNIIRYCQQKFSANVLEKCFENSSKELRELLINVIIDKDNKNIIKLLMDPYGNYVIQKALLVQKGDLYYKMLKIIANNINEIKKANFGNKLIVKLINKHKELGDILAEMKNY